MSFQSFIRFIRSSEVSEKELVKYPYSRFFIYSIFAIVLGWIIVSLSVSVGHSVFWEHKRENLIPENAMVELETDMQIANCMRAVEILHGEMKFKVARFMASYKKHPKLATDNWNKWYKSWKRDFVRFGKSYNIAKDTAKDDESLDKLKHAYHLVGKMADTYTEKFNELNDIIETDVALLEKYFAESKKKFYSN